MICSDCEQLDIYLQACLIYLSSGPGLPIRSQLGLKETFSGLSETAARGCQSYQVWHAALLNECFDAEEIAKVEGQDDSRDSQTPVLVGGFKYIGPYSQSTGA